MLTCFRSVAVLDTNTTTLSIRILNGVISDNNPGSSFISEVNKRLTPHIKMILPCDERPNLPPHSAVSTNIQPNGAVFLIAVKTNAGKRSDGDGGSVDKRRPDVDFFVSLVRRRDRCSVSDLLVLVSSVDLKTVVVNADLVVRVPGRESDLEVGGEEVRWITGDVEGVDGGVLEDETWL